jgi:hypothetical protein
LYCRDRLLNVINAENDPEVRRIRKNVFNRLDEIVEVFVNDFDRNFKVILAKILENRQLNIVNVKLDIGY